MGIGNFFKKIGEGIAGAAKKVGEAFKKGGEWAAKKIGDGVKNVVDIGGDIVGGAVKGLGKVTGIKALEKAGDKIDDFADNQLGPALSRTLQAPIKAVSGLPISVMEKGLIDGIAHQGAEMVQDNSGAMARLVGGKKAEEQFDRYYDEKVQKWIEMAASTVGRVAAAVVPGGQIILAADVASEVASLGYRAGNGEKLHWTDAIDPVVGVATLGVGSAASGVVKEGAKQVFKHGAKEALKTTGKATGNVALKEGAVQASKVAANETVTATAKEGAKHAVQAGVNQSLKSTGTMTGREMTSHIAKQSAKEYGQGVAFDLGSQKAMEIFRSQKNVGAQKMNMDAYGLPVSTPQNNLGAPQMDVEMYGSPSPAKTQSHWFELLHGRNA